MFGSCPYDVDIIRVNGRLHDAAILDGCRRGTARFRTPSGRPPTPHGLETGPQIPEPRIGEEVLGFVDRLGRQ